MSLLRVLRAYAVFDREVGYCQGMNFLAGLLLTWMPNEATAYAGLVVLMQQQGLRYLYKSDLARLQVTAASTWLDSDALAHEALSHWLVWLVDCKFFCMFTAAQCVWLQQHDHHHCCTDCTERWTLCASLTWYGCIISLHRCAYLLVCGWSAYQTAFHPASPPPPGPTPPISSHI